MQELWFNARLLQDEPNGWRRRYARHARNGRHGRHGWYARNGRNGRFRWRFVTFECSLEIPLNVLRTGDNPDMEKLMAQLGSMNGAGAAAGAGAVRLLNLSRDYLIFVIGRRGFRRRRGEP
jgi:hypothetical protein